MGAEESEEEQEIEGEEDAAEHGGENHGWLQPEQIVEVITPEEDSIVEVYLGFSTITDSGLRKNAGEASLEASSRPSMPLGVDECNSCNSISSVTAGRV